MGRNLLIFIFGVVLSCPAIATQLCRISPDPKNPRRVDIRFPNKTITVVGHTQPSFRDERNFTFDAYLWKQFNDPNLFEKVKFSDAESKMPAQAVKIRERIQLFLQKDAEAVKQWSEDLEIVKQALKDRTHQVFAIETNGTSMLAQSNEVTALNGTMAAVVNGAMILSELQFNRLEEREQIMSVALTPVLFLAHKGSEVFGSSTVLAVGYGQSEATAQTLAAERQSSLLLIDTKFLKSQSELLQKECLARLHKNKRTPSSNAGIR